MENDRMPESGNPNRIEELSFRFAIRIVRMVKYLRNTKKESVLSRQILRSGTSIGANVSEAQEAQSKADFISKMSISLKETAETIYWIKLFEATDYLTAREASSLLSEANELKKLLTSIIMTSKE